jgi:hypothetical protein
LAIEIGGNDDAALTRLRFANGQYPLGVQTDHGCHGAGTLLTCLEHELSTSPYQPHRIGNAQAA